MDYLLYIWNYIHLKIEYISWSKIICIKLPNCIYYVLKINIKKLRTQFIYNKTDIVENILYHANEIIE